MKFEFTDIHSHIIPGVDDGSENMETSLGLIDMAYEDGIRRMIATPHWGVINPAYDRELAEYRLAELRHRAQAKYPDIELYMGNEIFLAPGYPDGLDDGKSQTLAGSEYVLIEFPMEIDYEYVFHSCRKMLLSGYIPILAHAERYLYTYSGPDDIAELVNQGARVQINSSSLTGPAQSEASQSGTAQGSGIFSRIFKSSSNHDKRHKFAEQLLKQDLVHYIATDIHNMPGRQPRMTAAAEHITSLIGEDRTLQLFANSDKLLHK